MEIWITQTPLNHIDSSIDLWQDQKNYKISRIFVLTCSQRIYVNRKVDQSQSVYKTVNKEKM